MKISIGFCLLVLLIACKQEKNNEESTSPVVIKSVELNIGKLEAIDSFVDTMFLVPLETTDEALIGYNVDIQFFDSLIYMRSLSSSQITVFDMQGRVNKVFDKKGEGPMEYLNIDDYFVNEDGLFVFCRGTRKLNRYDINGNFLKKIDLSAYPFLSKVVPYRDRYVCYSENPRDNEFAVYVVDKNGGLINTYFEDRCYGSSTSVYDKPLSITSKGILANFVVDYNIYLYDGNDFVADMCFDFGDFNLSDDQIMQLRKNRKEEEVSNVKNKVTRIDNIVEVNNWTSYNIREGFRSKRIFINNRTDLKLSEGDGLFSHFKTMIFSKDDYFVGVIYSNYLTELLTNRVNLYKEEISLYEQKYLDLKIDEEDNPVLCFFKLKD